MVANSIANYVDVLGFGCNRIEKVPKASDVEYTFTIRSKKSSQPVAPVIVEKLENGKAKVRDMDGTICCDDELVTITLFIDVPANVAGEIPKTPNDHKSSIKYNLNRVPDTGHVWVNFGGSIGNVGFYPSDLPMGPGNFLAGVKGVFKNDEAHEYDYTVEYRVCKSTRDKAVKYGKESFNSDVWGGKSNCVNFGMNCLNHIGAGIESDAYQVSKYSYTDVENRKEVTKTSEGHQVFFPGLLAKSLYTDGVGEYTHRDKKGESYGIHF